MPRNVSDGMGGILGGGRAGRATQLGAEVKGGRITRPAAKILPPNMYPKPKPKSGISNYLENLRLKKIEAKRPKILPPTKITRSPKEVRLDRKLDSKRAALAQARAKRVTTSGAGVPWETPRNEMKLSNKIEKLRSKGATSNKDYFGTGR